MTDIMDTPMAELSHFGVKGMRWGVRNKVRSAGRRVGKAIENQANASFERRAGSVNTFVRVQNRAAQKFNDVDIPRINNKREYRSANFNQLGSNHKLTKQYEKEMWDAFDKRLQESLNREGTNVSGTRRYELEGSSDPNGPGWAVKVVDVKKAKHAEEDLLIVKLTRNSKGHITNAEIGASSMQQSSELVEEFLEHYGVKGMRWGVRKDRSTPVTTEAVINRGLSRKTKVKAKGGQGQDASSDAIKAAIQKQKLKKSGTAALSNQELRELQTRLQLEQSVKQLAAPAGKKFVAKTLRVQGEQQVQREVSRLAQETASKRRRG